MNMKLYNGTPHEINVVSGATLDSGDRKFKGGAVVATLQSNGALNAKIETQEGTSIAHDGVQIPTFHKKTVGFDPLPEGYDIYIVSVLYATAYVAENGQPGNIYVVADPVMSDDGKTFRGCRGISLF